MAPEKHLSIAEGSAKNDADPTLKAFAAATVDYLKSAPATQPATQPAPQGGTAPPDGAQSGSAAPVPQGVSTPSQSTTTPPNRGR